MNSRNKKTILISCAVILAISMLCLCLIFTAGAGIALLWPLDFRMNSTPSPQLPVESPVDPTFEPGMQNELPPKTENKILEIEKQVSQIRGLELQSPVSRVLITQEELEEIVINDFFADYSDEDERKDLLVLSLFGLLPADFDLKNFYNELYSEQIAGFYDQDTGKIFVLKGTKFGGSEKITYAHEFTHVLQDQTFKFDEGLNYNEEALDADSERFAAIQALIEGDASQTEILWFQTYASVFDYRDVMKSYENYSSPILDTAPPFMELDLYFPYEYGFRFVEHLYEQGGFDSVNSAYHNVPLSTEQIMHPERYPGDKPIYVDLESFEEKLGPNWVELDKNTMGEWSTYLILSQAHDPSFQLPEDQAKLAVEGWGGDAYSIYHNEETDEMIFIMDSVWDTSLDADEFAAALTQYANLRWGTASSEGFNQPTWKGVDGTIAIIHEGDRVLWVIAPNGEFLETLVNELK